MIRASIAGWIAVLGIAAIAGRPATAEGQTLDQLRHDIREGTPDPSASAPPAESRSHDDSHHQSCDDPFSPPNDDDDFGLGTICLEAIGLVVAAPYLAPFNMLGDNFDVPAYFLRYPYWHNEPGSMFTLDPYGARHRAWQTEWAFEFADNFDNLDRFGGHFRLSTTSRFDIESNWNTLEERTFEGRDHVTIGDVDLLFRFAQSEKLQFRSGLGANWFDDHQGAVAGFNFRYGVDWYPCRPWHLASVLDLGELGKTGLVHIRSTAGLSYARWELFTGYDYRVIGSVHFGGPLAGVQFRF